MNKYFPKMWEANCFEVCYMARKNIHIGSIACQTDCKHNKGCGKKNGKLWIYCDCIEKAKDIN